VRIVAPTSATALSKVASVRVKRVIKGELFARVHVGNICAGRQYFTSSWPRAVEVHSIHSAYICDAFVRRRDSNIFLLNVDGDGHWALNSSLLPITLHTLNQVNALVFSELCLSIE
jgi:hypothetical protein